MTFLDWHMTQQFVWWQLIIKIPAPAADKFSEWRDYQERGWGGENLYFILDRKGTPFTGLLNGTPFTYLVQNFASLFTAGNALSSQNQSVFVTFSQPKNASLSPLRPFYRLKWQISLPFHILPLVKSLATGRVPTHRAWIPIKIMKKSLNLAVTIHNSQKPFLFKSVEQCCLFLLPALLLR